MIRALLITCWIVLALSDDLTLPLDRVEPRRVPETPDRTRKVGRGTDLRSPGDTEAEFVEHAGRALALRRTAAVGIAIPTTYARYQFLPAGFWLRWMPKRSIRTVN